MEDTKLDKSIFENEKFINYYMTYFKAIEKTSNDDIVYFMTELNRLILTSELESNKSTLAFLHLRILKNLQYSKLHYYQIKEILNEVTNENENEVLKN